MTDFGELAPAVDSEANVRSRALSSRSPKRGMEPAALTQVPGVVYRTISHHVIDKTGLTRACGATGAVTLIQRFVSALNLNAHLHMLFLDGAYLSHGANELQGLLEQIAARVGQVLVRRGLIGRDIENAGLAAGAEPVPLDDLIGHSITYRIAVGARAGQKLFTLQTVPPRLQGLDVDPNGAARADAVGAVQAALSSQGRACVLAADAAGFGRWFGGRFCRPDLPGEGCRRQAQARLAIRPVTRIDRAALEGGLNFRSAHESQVT